MAEIDIRPLSSSPETIARLSALLVETVAHGGSVSFMHPLAPERAEKFWSGSLAAADRGERIVFGALDGEAIVGTVTLVVDCPPNQPHRAEIAKMMTATGHRGRGIATALLHAAEAAALEQGRWLIALDTATDEGASGLYEKLGYTLAGEIPDYALKPHGGLTGTKIYWKKLRRQ